MKKTLKSENPNLHSQTPNRFRQIVAEAKYKAVKFGIPETDRHGICTHALGLLAYRIEKLEARLREVSHVSAKSTHRPFHDRYYPQYQLCSEVLDHCKDPQ